MVSPRLMSPLFDLVALVGAILCLALLQLGAERAAHKLYDHLVDWIYRT